MIGMFLFSPHTTDHHYILLDYEGVIAMIDCTKSDRHAEITQCDWIIHVENGSVVSVSLLILKTMCTDLARLLRTDLIKCCYQLTK